MKVVIAAAGTGGHINPGIAIANEIMKQEPDSKIIFIGTPRGLENDLVPRAGYEVKQIDAYGLKREITLENLKRIHKTNRSIITAIKILKEFQPDIVIGMGGYISIAVGFAAHRLRIPIVLHESNAYPGVAVKVISRFAKMVFVGFEETKERLPRAKSVLVTGTPSKIEEIRFSKEEKEEKLMSVGLQGANYPAVLVFGGSQGARSINQTMLKIIEEQKNQNYQIIWAVGKNNYEEIEKEIQKKGFDIHKIANTAIVPYIYHMQEIMNAVDLVVCRSGAMTVTEVSVLEKPAIFIPFPFAAENHQEYNARVLEKVGAAKVILDKDLNVESLHDNIVEMIQDGSALKNMGKCAGTIAKKDVEKVIYQEIKKILSKEI